MWCTACCNTSHPPRGKHTHRGYWKSKSQSNCNGRCDSYVCVFVCIQAYLCSSVVYIFKMRLEVLISQRNSKMHTSLSRKYTATQSIILIQYGPVIMTSTALSFTSSLHFSLLITVSHIFIYFVVLFPANEPLITL